jgi:hypothetical protein
MADALSQANVKRLTAQFKDFGGQPEFFASLVEFTSA